MRECIGGDTGDIIEMVYEDPTYRPPHFRPKARVYLFRWLLLLWLKLGVFYRTTTFANAFVVPSLHVERIVASAPLHERLGDNDDAPLLWTAISATSITSSVVTLWSETSIFLSGCGPIELPDVVERVSYQAVILVAGVCWFTRLAFQRDPNSFLLTVATKNSDNTWIRRQLQITEFLLYLAVVGAVVVLLNQIENGAQMDGLSGIDIGMCKARHDFSSFVRGSL